MGRTRRLQTPPCHRWADMHMTASYMQDITAVGMISIYPQGNLKETRD